MQWTELDKLNNSIKCLPYRIKLYFGDLNRDFINAVNSLVPDFPVCVIYNQSTFDVYGKWATALFEKNNHQVTNVVFKDSENISLRSASLITGIKENTKLIITFDYKLYQLCYYVSSIKEIPTFFVARNYNVLGLLGDKINLLNGSIVERISVSNDRYVFFDKECVKACPSFYGYALSVKETVALFDYRIYCYFQNVKFNLDAYNLFKEGVLNAYKIFAVEKQERYITLLNSLLSIEIANAITGGEIGDNSSIRNAQYIYNLYDKMTGGVMIDLFSKIMGIYDIYFSGRYDKLLEYPDYNTTATLVSKYALKKEEDSINGLIKQLKVLENGEKIGKVKSVLLGEIQSITANISNVKNTFIALGGSICVNKENAKRAIKFSGDLTEKINGMSLIRESGILEFM